jgi:hypothetical protein
MKILNVMSGSGEFLLIIVDKKRLIDKECGYFS